MNTKKYVIGSIVYLLTGFYALSNKALRKSKMDPDTEMTN